MNTVVRATLFVAVWLVVSSCTYDFSEDYFNDMTLKEPNVNVVLTGFTNGEETGSSKLVKYALVGVGNGELEMIVSVDGTEVYWSQERTGEFYLAIDDLEDGQHKMTIEFGFPTNSGSLASKLGGEYFTGYAEYGFAVDRTLASSFGIESVKLVEGTIYIKLNPVTDENFEEAYLVVQNEEGYVVEERLISQEDLTDLEIHDSETVIYNPSYAVKVKNPFVENTSEFVSLSTPKMEFTTEVLGFEKFKLRYTAHPLYANFDKIGFDYSYNYSGGSFYTLNARGGETIIENGYYFGEKFRLNFVIFQGEAVNGHLFEDLQIGESLQVSGFEEIIYVPSTGKYFILDVNPSNELVIHQLNGTTLAVERSKTLVSFVSSGGLNSVEIDPATNALIINMNQKALVFDPVSFSVVSTHLGADYNDAKPNADVYYRGAYVILDDTWPSGQVAIYEKATGVQKFKMTKTTKFFSAVDASYFYANGGLYQLQSGEFVFMNKIQDSDNAVEAPALEFLTFDIKSNSAVLGWHRTTYYLDLSSNTQTRLWGPDDVYDVKYTEDGRPLINSYHYTAGYRSHLYNAQTNEVKTLNTYGQQSFRYFNGTIFSPGGFFLESDLYTF